MKTGFLLGGPIGLLLQYVIPKAVNKANTIASTITQERFEENSFYREQIGLGKDFKFDKKPFDDFVAARKKSIDELATTFATAVKDEKLKAALAKPEVKKIVQDAISKQGRTEGPLQEGETLDYLDAAQKEYTNLTQHFNKLAQKIPPLKVEAVIQTMKETIDAGIQSVQHQQQLEKENLKKLFEPGSAFVTKLTKEGVTDIDAVKKAMTTDLRKSHNEQMKAFKKSTSDSLGQLHHAAKSDYAEMNFLASISADSEAMKKLIRTTASTKQQDELTALDKKIKAKEDEATKLGTTPADRAKDQARKAVLENEITEIRKQRELIANRFGQIAGQLNADAKRDPHVGHIHLSDLPEIHSKTGAIIKQDKDKPGEFTLEFGMMISPFGPRGYFFGNKIQHDLDLMAEAVKASGKTDIQMTVNYSNEKVARERAEQAYRACVNAGYPPDKIKIVVKVNGQELGVSHNDKKEVIKSDKYWTPESVFTEKQLAEFKKKAEDKTEKEADIIALKTEGHDTQPVKNELAKLKAEHEAAEQEKQRVKTAASENAEENAEDELDENNTSSPTKTS